RRKMMPSMSILFALLAPIWRTRWWSGDRSHAGSVLEGSPVNNAAWQRQPPKSISLLGQDRHGSGIHSVPRNRLKLSEHSQIESNDLSRILSKVNRGIS